MNLQENVPKKEGFNQVCVFPGMLIENEKHIKDLVDIIKKDFGVRIQYLETIETRPDQKNGKSVEGTGGRHDVFVAIHDEDVMRFAIPRFRLGVRWIEDVLADCNYTSPIYPKRIFEYCTWNKEHLSSIR